MARLDLAHNAHEVKSTPGVVSNTLSVTKVKVKQRQMLHDHDNIGFDLHIIMNTLLFSVEW